MSQIHPRARVKAVIELQVKRAGHHYRSTEVYRFAGGRITELKAYFDPPDG